jgi:HlyD family secretion protein
MNEKNEVAQKTVVAQKPRSIKEAVSGFAKNRVAVVSAIVVVGLIAAAGAYLLWKQHEAAALPKGIVGINGRLEATQVDIATKIAGRVIEIVPQEGDMVSAGEVIARLDKAELEAQLAQGQAEAQRARETLARAEADVQARKADLTFAQQELQRAEALVEKGWTTREKYDQRKQGLDSATAALTATTKGIDEAQAGVKAADAKVNQLQAELDDTTIASPVRGRMQYRLIEPGAVLSAGGRIATILNLSDVYTTIFLPATAAGQLKIGDEARVVFDAAPQYVFPATVSFVAPESQFTPKSVETQSEREQLYFRVKLKAPLPLLVTEEQVKAGLRGMGYVKVDPAAVWPAWLTIKTPND